jgi:excisionase family DNA binding protein
MSRAAMDAAAVPNEHDAEMARDALVRVKRYLQEHPGDPHDPVRLTVQETGTEQLTLPRSVVEVVAAVLAHMAAGQSVTVVPHTAELTTQQAADLLNVSRPFLIGLLEAGEIEFHKVGTHRRIMAVSLIEYQRRDDARRRAVADDLTELSQELDLG